MTLSEISQKSGVSIATVSRILRNQCGVRKEKREAVLKILRDMGYNAAGFSKVLAQTGLKQKLDVLVFPLSEQKAPGSMPFYALIMDGIKSVLRESEFDLHFSFVMKPLSSGEPYYRDDCGGVLVVGFPPMEFMRQIELSGKPYVLICNNPKGDWTELVTVDKYREMYTVGQRIIGAGYRRVVILRPEIDFEIRDGVLMGMASCGGTISDNMHISVQDTSLSNFVAPLSQLLARKELPEILVISSRDVAELTRELFRARNQGSELPFKLLYFEDFDSGGCPEDMVGKIDSRYEGKIAAEWLVRKIRSHVRKDRSRLALPFVWRNDFLCKR